ncbi:MAG: hypothetical protein EBS06_05360 [Proteobacteria bacterium]|nr:hypothetical protein [Pseudomonadota bacterium]
MLLKLIISKAKFKKIFDNSDLIEEEVKKQKLQLFLPSSCWVVSTEKQAKALQKFAKSTNNELRKFGLLEQKMCDLFQIENLRDAKQKFYYERATDAQRDFLNYFDELKDFKKYSTDAALELVKIEEKQLFNLDY